jgi:hypothetical protein
MPPRSPDEGLDRLAAAAAQAGHLDLDRAIRAVLDGHPGTAHGLNPPAGRRTGTTGHSRTTGYRVQRVSDAVITDQAGARRKARRGR